jgi:hypothetical protein
MTALRLRRPIVLLLAPALVLAACGGDDDDAAGTDDPAPNEATEDGATPEDGATSDETGGDEASDDGGDGDDGDGDTTEGDGGSTASSAGGTATTAADASSTTTAAGGQDSPFALAAGEKPIPTSALVFVRPVPGAVYTYQSSAELGGGSLTYTVVGATETGGGGVDVDVDLSASFSTGPVSLGYLFRYLADGSIEVPFVDFSSLAGGSGVTLVEQPNFTFLDRPAVDAGSDFSGSTRAVFEISGTRIEATYDYVGRGLPRETITVPAGTFEVTPIQYDMTVSIGGVGAATIAMSSTFYLDDRIGMVRSTFSSDTIGSGSSDLVSCSLL